MRFLLVYAPILTMILTACNLGNVPVTPIPTPTELIPDGVPEISIISPAAGDEFVVNEEILVSVTASDQAGVTRVQLLANGQIVKSVSSESVEGDETFSAVLDYTPRAQGAVVLRAIAYRGATASDPDEIQVEVRSSQTQVTSTPVPGSNVPQIPNDGVCRALVNVGLNFREGPSTDNEIIRVLTSGTLAPITGRLGDNSWWELNVNGTTGWVAAEFTTPYGNCANVPIRQITGPTATPTLTRTPTLTPTSTVITGGEDEDGLPDLVITNIVGDEDVIIGAVQTYTVTVSNTGAGSSGQFLSEVEFADTIYDLAAVSNLDPGESIVLSVDLEFGAAGEFEFTARVDIDDDVEEVSEFNNRGDISITVEE